MNISADTLPEDDQAQTAGKVTVEKISANELRVTLPHGATIKSTEISEADLYFALSRHLLKLPSTPGTADCWCD